KALAVPPFLSLWVYISFFPPATTWEPSAASCSINKIAPHRAAALHNAGIASWFSSLLITFQIQGKGKFRQRMVGINHLSNRRQPEIIPAPGHAQLLPPVIHFLA